MHNSCVEVFDTGLVIVRLCKSGALFRDSGYTRSDDVPNLRSVAPPSGENVIRATRRARHLMRNIVLNNDFPWFVTLTFAPDKIDRYDAGEIVRRTGYWLNNNVKRKNLKYCLVPELHRDGAVHFHGFLNDALSVVDSGVSRNGKPVYNLPTWTMGFSTAQRIDNTERALAYALKYCGKSDTKVGGRWIYHGGDIRLPKSYNADFNADDLKPYEQKTYTTQNGLSFIEVRFSENADFTNSSLYNSLISQRPEIARVFDTLLK